MTLAIDAKNRQVMNMLVPRDDIQISNFRNYVLKVEGTQITSKDSRDKKLVLKIGTDGVLYLDIIGSNQAPVDDFSNIIAGLPNGFKECLRTQANKTIRGLVGKYLYFKNELGDYLAFAVGPSGKGYKIVLGNLSDKNSKLRQVLDHMPSKPFYKAYFNNILPSGIVENRQPIKAALDILEQENFVKKTGKRSGISDEYIRTTKMAPKLRRED